MALAVSYTHLDVYKRQDTACDLSVCLSMVSSLLDRPVSDKLIAIGEVGLGGEVRSVPNLEPVSYTHLDVYKRQRQHPAQDLPRSAGIFRAGRPAGGKQFQGPACPHRGRQAAHRCLSLIHI